MSWLVCLFRGHRWSEMLESGALDFFRECERCGKFWKIGPWTHELPLPPTPPNYEQWRQKCEQSEEE